MQSDILFEEHDGKFGKIGKIILNRPTVLNALNHTMIISMSDQLKKWQTQDSIKAIIIKAVEGRAFCAGGDLSLIYNQSINEDKNAEQFFKDEYALNLLIFHYPKPYIAFLDGITMGGGVGISIHGSHRVASSRFLFGMPETGIGFYPDVGGTYFLPRLAGGIGYYLGLTGHRLNADAAYELKIVQQLMEKDTFNQFEEILLKHEWKGDPKQEVTQLLDVLHQASQASQASHTFNALNQTIDEIFLSNTIEKIIQILDHSETEFAKQTKKILLKKSPTSLKVTLKAMQEGSTLSFDQCMQTEFHLTTKFLQSHDFKEGIRALIIDKDQRPHWQPETLEEVNLALVADYFN